MHKLCLFIKVLRFSKTNINLSNIHNVFYLYCRYICILYLISKRYLKKFMLFSPKHVSSCKCCIVLSANINLTPKLGIIYIPAKPLHNHDIVSVHLNHFYWTDICDKLRKNLAMLTYLDVDECWLTVCTVHAATSPFFTVTKKWLLSPE